MFLKNSRVYNKDGLVFYEKDILFDDYVYCKNIDINVSIDYQSPGFGIVLTDSDDNSLYKKNISYLFKIGYKNASIYYCVKNKLFLEKQMSVLNATTVNKNLKIKLTKIGKKIILYVEDNKIFEYYMKKNLDKFNFGIYSNSGNKINNIVVQSNTPNDWKINMKNTNGGYLKFLSNSFEFYDCHYNAEILQDEIELSPGIYYLRYNKTNINNKFDIKSYVYKSNDDRIDDEKKNILSKNNTFVVKKKEKYVLKFSGKNGIISNISISLDEKDEYIETDNKYIISEGSHIKINTNNLTKIEFKSIVYEIPENKYLNTNCGIIIDSKDAIHPKDTNIILGKEYYYVLNLENGKFEIYDKDILIFQKILLNIGNFITILKNLKCKITYFVLTDNNSKKNNVLIEEDNREIVPASVTSPIVVVDKEGIPYDLSSSYRRCIFKDYYEYVFTNYEREFFESNKKLYLEKPLQNKNDIIVYGIKDNIEIDLNSIYDVPENNINSIDCMTDAYDKIDISNYKIDDIYNIIYLKNDIENDYKYFIIDYLKKDSYAINFIYDKFVYEVDISNENKNTIIYDANKENNNIAINNNYITNINSNMNNYIVIRKEL